MAFLFSFWLQSLSTTAMCSASSTLGTEVVVMDRLKGLFRT